MTEAVVSPRTAAMIGLLALVPLAWYAISVAVRPGIVAGINVLVVIGCLLIAFRPVAGDHGHDAERRGLGNTGGGDGGTSS